MLTQQALIDPKKVAIYVRWSTDEQTLGTTLEIQRQQCERYIHYKNWEVSDELLIIDDGCSGATLDRPGLTRLRRLIGSGRVQCVVVYKLDRLSRNLVDCVNLVLREWLGRCTVYSQSEEFDTNTHIGQLIFNILAMFAEFERNMIRDRTLSGKYKRAEQGRNAGFSPPYGYRLDDQRKLVVDEAAGTIVRRIFDTYTNGVSIRTIQERLNAESIPSPRGRQWGPRTIRNILANRAYTGQLVYGKSRINPARRFSREQPARVVNSNPVVRDGVYPRLISDKAFEAAATIRAMRSDRRTGRSASASAYLLSGLIRCGKCGSRMIGNTSDRRYSLKYYQCPSRCDARAVRKERAEAAVICRVKAALAEPSPHRLVAEAQRRHRLESASRRQKGKSCVLPDPDLPGQQDLLGSDPIALLTVEQQKLLLKICMEEVRWYRSPAGTEQVEMRVTESPEALAQAQGMVDEAVINAVQAQLNHEAGPSERAPG